MSKNLKRKNLIFVFALLICLIILIVLMFQYNKYNKAKAYEEKMKDFVEFSQKFENETILARNTTVIYGYTGQYQNQYLFKNMKIFADYMYYLKETVDMASCESFYNQKKAEIEDIIGIKSYEEFNTFMSKLNEANISEDTFEYAAYEVGSGTEDIEYFSFNVSFFYGDDNHEFKFKTYWALNKDTKVDLKYEIL